MKKLDLYSVENVDTLAWPNAPEEINEMSSALNVFTDFKVSQPIVIDAHTPALEAEKYMLQSHVRLKIVVDENNHFLGLVSLDDLNAQEIMKKVSHGEKRDDLCVRDFMRTKHELQAFDYEELEHVTIMDVIHALKTTGQQHCLVVSHEDNQIRGIISASDISRKLRLPLNIAQHSSFVSIFNVLHH